MRRFSKCAEHPGEKKKIKKLKQGKGNAPETERRAPAAPARRCRLGARGVGRRRAGSAEDRPYKASQAPPPQAPTPRRLPSSSLTPRPLASCGAAVPGPPWTPVGLG